MFKIRKKIFPDEGYKICEQKYASFLNKKEKYIDDDLLRMFRYDYFHDGSLLDFKYDFENSFIKLHLICPNFISDKGDYVNVGFYLNFYKIKYFQIDIPSPPQIFSDAVFLYGELGTLACSDAYISLIMEFITPPLSGSFFVSIISQRIEVVPQERLALKILLDSKKISLEE